MKYQVYGFHNIDQEAEELRKLRCRCERLERRNKFSSKFVKSLLKINKELVENLVSNSELMFKQAMQRKAGK